MLQPIVRHSENWKFSHAAAAMGAYWARARKIEARRVERLRQRRLTGTRVSGAAPADPQRGAASQN